MLGFMGALSLRPAPACGPKVVEAALKKPGTGLGLCIHLPIHSLDPTLGRTLQLLVSDAPPRLCACAVVGLLRVQGRPRVAR